MSYDFDLFVIGAGSGGVRCARIAASHGAKVGIAEERHWGGTCVNLGCVPKKMLVQAGEYGAWAEDARGFGWNMVRGSHDWAALIAAKDREIERLNGVYISLLQGSHVALHDARAVFVDPHTLDVGGQRITAERIVIATGSHAVIRPHIEGSELGITSDQAFHLPHFPRRVVLVGGGYIGVEFAGIFRHLGAEVHLVYRQHHPLRGFDEDIRLALTDALQADGIHLHPSATVHRVREAGAARVVELSSGAAIETDLAFFAVGRVPNTRGLGLHAAGVEVTEGGSVRIDASYRTTQPHIFAIGDVANKLNLTPVAIAEGHHLAELLFGTGPARSWHFTAIPTAVFSSPPIGTVGLTEAQAAEHGVADIYTAHFTPMRHTLSGRKGRKTFMKLVVDQPSQRVIGAHMLGEDAAEMMQGIGIAITAGATKADFDRTVGIHPTAAEEWVTLRTITRSVGG